MALQPLKVERLYRQISNVLIKVITEGQFKVGETLPSERELAKSLGVGRSSVREALIALEIAGWVEIRTGNGVFVMRNEAPDTFSLDDDSSVEDLIETREVIEGEIARLAAKRRTPEQLEALREHLDAMAEIEVDNDEFRERDRRFHMLISDMTGNPVLREINETVWNKRHSAMHRRFESHYGNAASTDQLMVDHTAIYDAIADGDAVAARKAMLRHLETVRKRFFQARRKK